MSLRVWLTAGFDRAVPAVALAELLRRDGIEIAGPLPSALISSHVYDSWSDSAAWPFSGRRRAGCLAAVPVLARRLGAPIRSQLFSPSARLASVPLSAGRTGTACPITGYPR